MMPCSAALALIVVSGVTAQFDGNPHGWDRKRRCDHTAYEPPCGACEGYGRGVIAPERKSQYSSKYRGNCMA